MPCPAKISEITTTVSPGPRLARFLSKLKADLRVFSGSWLKAMVDKKINDIFKEHGELFFRNEELNFFEKKINQKQIIISSGGGSFINKEIQKKIKKDCISIWLKASKETLANRLKNKKNRPLLNVTNFEDTLSLLLNERNAIYEKADITITIDKLDKVKILQAIIKSLESLK